MIRIRKRGKNWRALLAAIAALILSLWLERNYNPNPEPEAVAEVMTGRVLKVHDGDTFTMLGAQGREIKVRLFGLDAPELNQAHGRESGAFLRERINGREVKLEVMGQDQYGRLLALLNWPDGRSISHEMLAEGQAWVYDRYCDIDQCAWFRKTQEEAREAGRGLWGDDKKPVPPWDYRRAGR